MLEPHSPTAEGAGRTDLRAALRKQTRASHETVEALYERYDIAKRDGLETFLQAHAIALNWCLKAIPAQNGLSTDHMRQLREALDTDLARLDAASPGASLQTATLHSPHPLGVIYVVAGSRMGAKVLLSKLDTAEDSTVRQTRTYLTCPAGDELWRDTKTKLKAWDGAPGEEAEVLAAARLTFDVFGAALAEITES